MSVEPVKNLAALTDLALLAPEATRADVERICADARAKSYRAVCVHGSRVELAYTLLGESNVHVAGLVGFPFGAGDRDVLYNEAETAVDYGAQEIDFVINVGKLKEGDHRYVLRGMRDIAEAAADCPVKAILEIHLLAPGEKLLACQLALDSGVEFVCTATDFHSPPVSVEDVKLLRENLGPKFGIKAAGQIRDLQTAQDLITAGATRIGVLAPGF